MKVNTINPAQQANFSGLKINQKNITNTLYAALFSASMLGAATATGTDSFTKSQNKNETKTEMFEPCVPKQSLAEQYYSKGFRGSAEIVNDAIGADRDSIWGWVLLIGGFIAVVAACKNKD